MSTSPDRPTRSPVDAAAVVARRRGAPARELPPDIITMEIEVGAPPVGLDTVGFDDDPTAATRPAAVRRRLGRFTVLGELGRGAMGTVLEAHDDTLTRTVALKLLHGRVDASRKDRLLREAQALAQLSHPNVVQVYEVGLVEDQMFIAMELVEGQTLRQWQRGRRPWREVVDVYLQAGRGLAAAHARDLVHRDFKPDNCILGDDGGVKVLDFGLARGSKAVDEPTRPLPTRPLASAPVPEDNTLQQRMTQSGKVLGTLSYLPLRQLMGRPADAKSDQYCFCVSLYEALYGVLPFRDRSMAALVAAQRAWELQPVPRGVRVPRRLRKILLRGLAVDPDARWRSMPELLAALEGLLQPRRWPVAAMLVVGFGTGAIVFTRTPEEPCANPQAALEDTWGPGDRRAVEAAFLNSGHAEAPELLGRVRGELDAYTHAWVQMREQSCRATFVSHTQPEAAFDRTMRCLARHHGRLRATIDALADVSTGSEALSRTILPFKLPGLASCADLETSEPTQVLPTDPEQREHVAALRAQIDRANTLAEAGAIATAIEGALVAVEQARRVGHEPTLAEALETLGRLQAMGNGPLAEATLQEAIGVAARAKDDTMAARAWSSLVYALMVQDELDRGLSLRFAATAAIDRAGDPVARAWLLNNLGTLYGQRREHEEAREHFEQALEVKRRLLGPEHIDMAITWSNLGSALKEERSLEEAREAFERARSIFVDTVGQSHLYVAYVETGLGHVRQLQDDLGPAAEHQRRALDIRERALGPDHVQVAKSLEYLGKVRMWQGEHDEAVGYLQRALEIYERALGPRSAQVGTSALNLAEAELLRGQVPHARALTERALELLEAAGEPHERAKAYFLMARVLEHEPDGRPTARALAEQAFEALDGFERATVELWLQEHPATPAG